MAASSRVEPYKYDVCLLGHDGRSTSKNFAYALADYLKTECNLNVFLNLDDVLPGQSVFTVIDAFEKSKFIVPVMCRAFIEDCWNNYTARNAFLDRLKTDRFIPLYVLDVSKQDINNIKEIKKYNVTTGVHFGDVVLPNENPEALDKLRRALTAGISQPEQDDRNNGGQGDVSNEETISEPQEETALPCDVNSPRDDTTGGQPPPLLQRQSGHVECQQEGDEGPDGPHFSDETVEGQPQPGSSSLGGNGLPSQDSPPPPPPPPPLALVDTSHIRDSGFADAPEERGPPSPPAAWYSPVSPMPQTQSEVFQGLNREDRDREAMGEETAEEGQEQANAVEDANGENSVQGWMGSLFSFLRGVAPALWTCILCTENSTPQLFPAKTSAKNDHCKD